jgi:hypothetical protein
MNGCWALARLDFSRMVIVFYFDDFQAVETSFEHLVELRQYFTLAAWLINDVETV